MYFFTSMLKTLHKKFHIKYYGKYFDDDVDATSPMMYGVYDGSNTIHVCVCIVLCFLDGAGMQLSNIIQQYRRVYRDLDTYYALFLSFTRLR